MKNKNEKAIVPGSLRGITAESFKADPLRSGIVLFDENGKIVSMNLAMQEYFNTHHNEVCGKKCYEFCSSRNKCPLFGAGNSKESIYEFNENFGYSGVSLKRDIFEIRNDKSETVRFIESIQFHCSDDRMNISDLINNTFASIIERIRSFTVISDLYGRVFYVTGGSKELWSFPVEEYIGRNCELLWNPEDAKNIPQYIKEGLEAGFNRFQARIVDANGRERLHDLKSYAIFDETGNMRVVVTLGEDVTGIKALSINLKKSNRKLREKNAQERKLSSERAMLIDLLRLITSNLEYFEVLKKLASISMKLMSSSKCALILEDDVGAARIDYQNNLNDEMVKVFNGKRAKLADSLSLFEAVFPYHVMDLEKGRDFIEAEVLKESEKEYFYAFRMEADTMTHGYLLIDSIETIDPQGENVQMTGRIIEHASFAIRNSKMYKEIKDKESKLSKLIQSVAAREEEYKRNLSHELHDSTVQRVLDIVFSLESIKVDCDSQELSTHLERNLNSNIEHAIEQGKHVIDELRTVINELRPSSIEIIGLRRSLETMIDRFIDRYSHETEFRTEIEELGEVGSEKEIVIYKVIQEALNNALKHSEAKRIEVSLKLDNGIAKVRVSDNGIGFGVMPEKAMEKGFGLIMMSEKVMMVGGTLKFIENSNGGVSVMADVSLSGT